MSDELKELEKEHDEHEHHHDECCGHDHEEHEHHHHHDDDDDDCCCGHDHESHDHHQHEEEEHEHHHHHDDDGDCCCGHDHEGHEHHHHDHDEHEHHHHHHDDDDDDDCCCGHDHEGHEHHHEEVKEAPPCTSKAPMRIYIVENLDCANCAAKIERKIQSLPGVEYASLTFATKQLRVAAKNQDELFPKMVAVCNSIEPDAKIIPREETKKKDDKEEKDESRKNVICIISGAVLLIAAKIMEKSFPIPSLVLYILAYLILGLEIVITAIKNIFKGNVLDENFLMSIATIGAFATREYPEAVGVMLFYRIGEWFEDKAVERSRSQIMDALDLRPETVQLVEDGNVTTIPAGKAQIGDIVMVRPGDRIPLDGTIIEGESQIDTSAITGEPVPVSVKEGASILSGCMNLNGVLKLKVDKPLAESMVTRILDSVENAAASKPKIDRFITKFSRVYTPFVVALAVCTAIIPSLVTGDWNKWVYTALTFLVISCPCALVLSVPLAFFSGIGAGSKKGILFKGGVALEALKDVKAVVCDKTGTITKGNFIVQDIVSADASLDEREILKVAASCEAASTHPIAYSIKQKAEEEKITDLYKGSISEISGHGILLEAGSHKYLCGSKKLLAENGVDTAAYDKATKKDSYGTEVLLAKDNVLIGFLKISDTIKEEAVSAIAAIKKQGIATAMLTGDTEENAKKVSEMVGIDMYYGKLLPENKLSKLNEIREEKGAVMFVGDGINDAPVLAGADVGAAMGSGADAAMEAADVVFLNSDMDSIPTAIRIARFTGRISKENVIFALAVKALIMILGLAGIASMWLAVFADTGVAMLCILNSIRILYKKQ